MYPPVDIAVLLISNNLFLSLRFNMIPLSKTVVVVDKLLFTLHKKERNKMLDKTETEFDYKSYILNFFEEYIKEIDEELDKFRKKYISEE